MLPIKVIVGYADVWVIVVSLVLESVSYTTKLLLSDNIVCGKRWLQSL